MRDELYDLVIIGGGVMGLSTAYSASHFTNKIAILEKSIIGNPKTASFGYTRSIRNDYLDPLYAQLAYEARRLWLALQERAAEPFLFECGCLNIAKASVTPDLDATYAQQSYRVLSDLHFKTEAFARDELRERYPQFDADLGRLDVEAGFLYLPTITRTLLNALHERQVQICENIDILAVEPRGERTASRLYTIHTSSGDFTTRALVITAGLGTNDLLKRIEGWREQGQTGKEEQDAINRPLQFPLSPDRPSQCKYFIPPADQQERFTPQTLPVFAYLDVGIYGHPMSIGKTPGVKIGFYNPPDIKKLNTQIRDVYSFVEECMPSLRNAQAIDVMDVDQCYYDLVDDDNFILGNLPGCPGVYVGVGWRGTGYKYAPWVGQTLAQLALHGKTIYDICRFSPERFVK